MYKVVEVTGYSGGECYLIVSERSAVLIDAGLGFCAEKAARNIKTVLGDRPLDYILLTHSHYDHVAGAPVIQEHYPMARTVASAYTKTILDKEKARDAMRTTESKHAKDAGIDMGVDRFNDLRVDIVLADEELLRLPDMTIQAMDAPGHTKCCMNFYFVEEGLLVASESIGYSTNYPVLKSGMVVSYRSTMSSIERAAALKPQHLLLAHTGLIPDEDVSTFFQKAAQAVETCATFVVGKYKEGCTLDEILDAYKVQYYDKSLALVQSKCAFLMNAEAMITRLLQELELPMAPCCNS